MYRSTILLLALYLLLFPAIGQAQPDAAAWGSVFVNGPYRKGWGLHLDMQVRSDEQMQQTKTWLFRPGIQYQLNKQNLITVGYAYILGLKKEPGIKAQLPEHRLWQQWMLMHPLGRFSLQHRLRFEERFIGAIRYQEGAGIPTTPIFSTRLRYFNRMILPLSGIRPFEKGIFGALQNEVFLHITGKNDLTGKTMDQNRFYLAMGYRANRTWDAEFGYIRRDLQTETKLLNLHTWQFAIYFRP